MLTYFDFPESKTDGVKSGGMKKEEFEKLVVSIKENGLTNPVFVEDDNVCLRVQLGNNRIHAMKQLGHDHIKAVVVTKGGKDAPAAGAQDIPLHKFEAFMSRVHPGDTKYRDCPYARNIRGTNRQGPE